MSSFSDDEPPPAISSAGPRPSQADRVRLVVHSNNKAPLEQNMQQVLLEVIDKSSAVERSGLDLVAVLDVSGSMTKGDKLKKMKIAMKFVIGKLGPMDRLSIVTFSDNAERRCRLHCMTRDSKAKLINDIVENGLTAWGGTNMEDGLLSGLKVLDGRRHKAGRVGSIILMSDGEQGPGDATRVSIGNVAVYTFGFGADNDAEVLEKIASNSQGGTFYFVGDGESLSEHFSQILAGLLSVVVQDLKLTVWEQPGHSEIDKVDAGGYDARRTRVDSFTVSFGDLYSGEERKVIVDLLLPAVPREYRATTVLFAKCRYSIRGKYMYSPPADGDYLRCDMRRTGRAGPPDAVKPEVKVELVHCLYIETLREASALKKEDYERAKHEPEVAKRKMEEAKRKLKEAKRKLEEAKRDLDAEQQQSSSTATAMIDTLWTEVVLLLNLATWKEFISCLLASWTSHYRRRFAGIGDVRTIRIFATSRMHMYMMQAKMFDKNPKMPVPSVDDDAMEEEAAKMVSERRSPVTMADHHRPRPRTQPRIPDESRERTRRSCSRWAWRAAILLCTVLAIAVIVAGAAVFAVFLLYKPKMPRLVVSDAHLGQLQYGQDGAIGYLQASITIVAENNNSKADASFSRVDLVLGFHGADVALLRADPFVVARKSSLPLRYNVVSAGRPLDPAGMQAMDEALKAGVVPLDLFGKARTKWKVGIFVNLKFWTRFSCRLRFFFPGNGTVMTTDRQRCRSRSP